MKPLVAGALLPGSVYASQAHPPFPLFSNIFKTIRFRYGTVTFMMEKYVGKKKRPAWQGDKVERRGEEAKRLRS